MKKIEDPDAIITGEPLTGDHFLKEPSAISMLKTERKILLDLGNDITKVRDKNDLIILFSKRIKGLFYCTHTIVTLIDEKSQTYFPFLLDHEASPIREHAAYKQLISAHFPMNEPFIKKVLDTLAPVSFMLEDVINQPGSPAFLKVNYEAGITEILMATLWNADRPIGFLHIYSDRSKSFSNEFRDIVKGIIPQLSGAVSNIIKNEAIIEKENEKSFLLDFSKKITRVRSKQDLDLAVQTTLKAINPLHGYAVYKLNDDKVSMSTYISDTGFAPAGDVLGSGDMVNNFPINDGLQNRVLESSIPLLFSVEMELRRGITSTYLRFWHKVNVKTVVGIALRQADISLGILWLEIEDVNIQLLQGISEQISTAMANIIANEAVRTKEMEQSFLIGFCNDVAGVRTQDDLKAAISKVLEKMLHTKLAMIQLIDDDGINLTPFMYDRSLFEKALPNFEELVAQKIDINEAYTVKVLRSEDAVIFDVEEQLREHPDNPFAQLWSRVGYKNTYAARLRVGDTNMGTLWLLADHVSHHLLKGICSQISIAIANIKANERLLQYKQQLEQENSYLKEQIKTIYNFSEIIGTGVQMQHVYHLMTMVAASNSTVLILGETGTGKELIARAIHNASPRNGKLMVKVNCAAMPANLIESELFGHERGAFTGAIERRIGKFELAHNGTLFLDEIGEMPLEAQVKLLRVIQEREVERVGGRNIIKVDVRIITATNRNLEEEVKAGRFRSDLYYRLNVFPIQLPPLRERAEDVEALANFFVSKYNRNAGKHITRIAPKVMQQLKSYSWPGNVRELEHSIERSLLMASGNLLAEIYLPKSTQEKVELQEILSNRTLEDLERAYIIQVLKRCNGKISGDGGAAAILDIPGNTLHSKIKKLAIKNQNIF